MKRIAERYNFSKLFKLQNICSKDDIRPSLQYLLFENNNVTVTDSYIYANIPVSDISNLRSDDIEKLNGFLIHKDVFAKLLKMDRITSITEMGIIAFGNNGCETFPIYENGSSSIHNYPDCDKAIHGMRKRKPISEVSFPITGLSNLCKALSEERPILAPNGNTGGIKVRFANNENIDAMIMPSPIDGYECD